VASVVSWFCRRILIPPFSCFVKLCNRTNKREHLILAVSQSGVQCITMWISPSSALDRNASDFGRHNPWTRTRCLGRRTRRTCGDQTDTTKPGLTRFWDYMRSPVLLKDWLSTATRLRWQLESLIRRCVCAVKSRVTLCAKAE